MPEHVHEWKPDLARRGYYCDIEGCTSTLLLDEAIPRLNATERLKGYRAKGAALCLEGAGCSNYTDELIAYADILETKC